ncbi:hypothetical protein ABZT49_03760 [Methylobacterium sp. EM32]|uniref:hypothetical protein n=1 Tax=Methylobacterium sp. EM32 TaxID=3163481 RepID=UPI0033B85050
MTPRPVTAPSRPVLRAVLRDRRLAAILLCLLAWGIGTASCWSKRASQPPHPRSEAG